MASVREFDVVVVGAGNAALTAALAAREQGASVMVLERAPYDERGGNSRYTAGAIRFAHNGLDDLLKVMPDLNEDERKNTEFGTYTRDEYFDDMARMTRFRCDPDLAEMLIDNSLDTLVWMGSKGVKFQPSYGRQAFKVDGRFKFWGGLCLETWGGGPGLVDALLSAIEAAGIKILYGARAVELITSKGGVTGVVVREGVKTYDIQAKAVVLASGGFEANTEWRTRYLGPGWDLAPVRGTRFNTGDGIKMALDIGAMSTGNWSGCHAVGWDRNAPPFGDLAVGDGFQKHSYPLGIMVNATGKRFVDEGADFRNYTYAKYGHEVLAQPGQFAWQVFDAKVSSMLRDEYRIRQVTKVTANTIEELAAKLDDVDAGAFVKEVEAFNAAVRTDIAFDPSVKDGRCTEGLDVPKSHWANPLDTPPYEAYAITCGITFTFGGLKISTEGHVIDSDGMPIPGLYAAGELVGGLFYFNYPGGTGLMSGAVFGRAAGASAGRAATG
ncbi:MAG: FAD-dependent tricarballylate dehydrogenase TcuA [Rhodospirillales bacterium]|nr:FAD-dependent tricarballylate dehydrogenase TcuA [Rhodospirillales bacterium]